jgi:hypothetical protein
VRLVDEQRWPRVARAVDLRRSPRARFTPLRSSWRAATAPPSLPDDRGRIDA